MSVSDSVGGKSVSDSVGVDERKRFGEGKEREQAAEQAQSAPFIHFMLSIISQTLANNAPVIPSKLKTLEVILTLIQ